MARLQFSPASPASQMSGSNSSVWSGSKRGGGGEGGAEKLVSDIESLLHLSPDESFSDVSIFVEGKRVHAHRCILAVRCPYFRIFFSAAAAKERERKEDNTAAAATASVMEVKLETVMRGEKVGYEAFMAVMSYVYGSGTKEFAFCVSCFDSSCPHVTCRPAIEFVLEILRASSVLEISDLKAAAQQHLVNVVTYTQVDEVLLILAVAETHQVAQLYTMCLQVIASSDLDTLTLEKELSRFALGDVMDQRLKLGLPGSAMSSLQLKQCKRIYRQCLGLWSNFFGLFPVIGFGFALICSTAFWADLHPWSTFVNQSTINFLASGCPCGNTMWGY
jgi:regulatory protein NPR1